MSEKVFNTADTGLNSPFSGAISGLYGDVLQGWALDNSQPDQRLVIDICIDGTSVAVVRADQYQPDASTGDQFHGFSVQLNSYWLQIGRQISARVANQSFTLEGSLQIPAKLIEDPAPITSQVWYSDGLRISGWSWDPQAQHRHVQITVREGSRVLGHALCNIHHQGLLHCATSDHAFSFDLPWEIADGKVHILSVENDMGQPLSGSPIKVCCWPEGLQGLLYQYDQVPDEQTMTLLTQVAREQSLFLPKSAGFRHYPQWFELFQHHAPKRSQPQQGKLGVLLISEGDSALESISVSSLRGQRAIQYQIAKGSAEDVLPALAHLLKDGCDRIVPLFDGDRLGAHALEYLSEMLNDGSAWGFADCDRDGVQGERSFPWFKPVWDIDLFIGADIFTPGAIFSASILNQALTLLTPLDGLKSLNWQFLLAGIALASEMSHANVVHLPKVLYHRHYLTPASPEMADASMDRHQAIAWLSQCLTPGALVRTVPGFPALLRAQWPLPNKLPLVSLIVPTRDQVGLLRTCIEGLLEKTDYPHMEIIVVDNQSSDPETLAYLEDLPGRGVKVLPYPKPFNYSAINNYAAKHTNGELIGLINNDIEILETGWLKEMVSQALRPNVGAVGAKLLWPNRMVQHAGVVIGVNGLAAHTGNNLESKDPGYLGLNQITRRQNALTAACLIIHRGIFNTVNGLDENLFPVAFNDVDLCLRIQNQGAHLIWTPFANLIHAESASRGKDQTPEKRARAHREQQGFIERWSSVAGSDPYYHPALSLDYLSGPYGGLAIPPRLCTKRMNIMSLI
ncbi:glycosyltransferase [Pseudomonas syringae]|nr:glycosyltransferase [Pseudomonas syringae]MBD8802859.1 glycosyltransferase [Pseudomonas syringae]MBD8813571.1 glycosyltransferase [Pseudomonas syringae]